MSSHGDCPMSSDCYGLNVHDGANDCSRCGASCRCEFTSGYAHFQIRDGGVLWRAATPLSTRRNKLERRSGIQNHRSVRYVAEDRLLYMGPCWLTDDSPCPECGMP